MRKKLEPIVLDGTPLNRGKIHGETLQKNIWEMLDQTAFETTTFNSNLDDFVDQFYEETDYINAVKKWAPNLYEELQGIAQGAGVDLKVLFMHNCSDEVLRFLQSKGIELKGIEVVLPGCSSIGCNKTPLYPAMQGQNLDTILAFRGFETLFYIKESTDLHIMTVGWSGNLGPFGINNVPIAVNLNTINCNYNVNGLPLQFVGRKILEQTSLENIVKFMQSIQTGAAQNYMFGDNEQILDYEGSANAFTQYFPCKNYQYIYHTNHPLANKDTMDEYKPNENTLSRFNFLEKRMRYGHYPISLENMKHILSSHFGPICAHDPQYLAYTSRTWVSVISVLSEDPEFHVAVGNPCENPYFRYEFMK